jgi:hypothetical protein
MDITKFVITDKQYLKISHDTLPIEKLSDIENCCEYSYIDIRYVDEDKNISILIGSYDTSSFSNKMATSKLLANVLEGKAVYDKTVNGDLGFLYNQYREEIIDSFIGFDYSFLAKFDREVGSAVESWLYNDKEGNIIFEITPLYPWNDPVLRKDPRRVTYKKFMKNYKPILQTIIPKESIRQWIKQGKELNKLWFNE